MINREKLVKQLQENFDGKPWHGTSLRRMLDGIDDAKSRRHPLPNAKSIAEILGHITAWVEITRRRLTGEEFNVTPEMDFPNTDGVPWTDLIAGLDRAFADLLKTLAKTEEDVFSQMVAGKGYSAQYMLHGLMHHNPYHAAQIGMLKK